MEFTEEQDIYIEHRLEELLAWHCSEQLPGYADLFRTANLKFQTGQTTREDLEHYTARFKDYWQDLVMRVIPVLGQLLKTSNQEQINQLFLNLDEKNRDWKQEFIEQTAEERRIEYQERVGEELERWFGPLNQGQHLEVKKWALLFKPLGLEGLEMRKKWQHRLRKLFDERKNVSSVTSGLKELLLRPEQFRPVSYQRRLDENKKVTIELIYQVGKQLNHAQRSHLASEIISVAADFDDLSCKGENIPGRLASKTNE